MTKRTAIQVLKEAGWAPLGVLFAHGFCGELLGHEPYVDPVMHFLGGAAITYFVRHAAVRLTTYLGSPSELGFDLGSFGAACFVAIMWELGEWSSDLVLGTRIQRDAAAPLRDLAIGLLGAGAYLALRNLLTPKNIADAPADPAVGAGSEHAAADRQREKT